MQQQKSHDQRDLKYIILDAKLSIFVEITGYLYLLCIVCFFLWWL